ncbi:hypothetical protein PoB_003826100 [Plakobranchus ocellatus]|uniref:Uncharacterized protein n=1 Tax=Plakobranchus ocellatus TaxID=259542 RepID=A0AAV4AKR0_9GAST|nr:hypothetical protein PoB_003826100 [Plakobranchus ocellatus]
MGKGSNKNFIRLTENRLKWRNMIANICSRQVKEGFKKETACPQQGDLRLFGPPSNMGIRVKAQAHDRRVPAYLRAALLSTVPMMPPNLKWQLFNVEQLEASQMGANLYKDIILRYRKY